MASRLRLPSPDAAIRAESRRHLAPSSSPSPGRASKTEKSAPPPPSLRARAALPAPSPVAAKRVKVAGSCSGGGLGFPPSRQRRGDAEGGGYHRDFFCLQFRFSRHDPLYQDGDFFWPTVPFSLCSKKKGDFPTYLSTNFIDAQIQVCSDTSFSNFFVSLICSEQLYSPSSMGGSSTQRNKEEVRVPLCKIEGTGLQELDVAEGVFCSCKQRLYESQSRLERSRIRPGPVSPGGIVYPGVTGGGRKGNVLLRPRQAARASTPHTCDLHDDSTRKGWVSCWKKSILNLNS